MKTKLSQKGRTHTRSLMAFSFLVIAFLLIPMASAAEFDNVKDYDEENKVVTVTNAFGLGDVIGEARLRTPHNNYVGAGYQKVAELDIWAFEDYDDAIKEFRFIDMKTMEPITRDIDLKFKSYEEFQVETFYYENCRYVEEYDTDVCDEVVNGTKPELREVWTEVTPANLDENELMTIGIFTEVQIGDHVDWIPTIYGVEVEEWAEWTQSLNTDLVAYWKLNETSGSAIDSVGGHDGTTDATQGAAGLIGTSYDFTLGSDELNIPGDNDFELDTDFSVCGFTKTSSGSLGNRPFISKWDHSANREWNIVGGNDGNFRVYLGDATTSQKLYTAPTWADINTDTWSQMCFTWNGSDLLLYHNGTGVTATKDTDNTVTYGTTTDNDVCIGCRYNGAVPQNQWGGAIDEVGIWQRVLTPAEISDLWNDGAGITWTDEFGSAPTATLTSPANTSTIKKGENSTIDLIGVATDAIEVENVTLYINGAASETNTSSHNGTYTFTKTLNPGYYNWSILVWNNNSASTQSDTWFFNYTTTSPFISLTSPVDDANFTTSSITMIADVTDDTGVKNVTLYLDGVANETNSSEFNGTYSFTKTVAVGVHNWSILAYDEDNRSSQSATREFNYTPAPTPETTFYLFTPANNSNTTIASTNFIFNVTNPGGIINVTLYINGAANQSNGSGINASNYTFNTKIPDGLNNWKVLAWDVGTEPTFSDTYYFTVHTTAPTPTITAPAGTFDFIKVGDNETLTYNVSEAGFGASHINECWYTYGDVLDSFENDVEGWEVSLGYVASPNRTNNWSTEGSWSAYLDRIGMQMVKENINATRMIFDYKEFSGESQLTVYDDGVPIWQDDGEANDTIVNFTSGSDIRIKLIGGTSIPEFAVDNIRFLNVINCSGTTLNFSYRQDKNNITVFGKDVYGLTGNATSTWNYNLTEISQQYNSTVIEGSTNNFAVNLSSQTAASVTNITFNYNGAVYQASYSNYDTDKYYATASAEAPDVVAATNVPFYWNVSFSNGASLNTSILNQTVVTFGIDNCSLFTFPIMNISLFDEEDRTNITGNIETNIELNSKTTDETITSYNSIENSHNFTLCVSSEGVLSQLYLDAEIRYSSVGYASELYYIQSASLDDLPINISLYDLNASDSTEFKITYQDNTFNFVESAVVQLQRKYISEGTYQTVEAPLTSNEGTAIVHIDLDSYAYRAVVVKEGEVLNTFDNLVFSCESELAGECTQKLLGSIDPQNEINYDKERDLAYSTTSDNDSVTLSFTVPSGSPAVINVQLSQHDQFGNETLCNQTVVSSSGLIECTYNATLGDSYLRLKLFKNGEPVEVKGYLVPEANAIDFLQNNFVIATILILTLVGLALTSPEWIVIMGIVSLVIAGMLWLVNGLNFVMGLGLIMFLVIAAGIIISKLAKQEDR